jgi:ligand-binding sensor domain-containing protein
VNTIAKDLSGNIWFGTPKGISKMHDNEWENFTTENGLVSNRINTIAVDLDGSVWVGTDNGISHYVNNAWVNFTWN